MFALDQYAPYVWASYALFAAVLLWDFLMPRIHMRRARRELAARIKRESARANRSGANP